MLDHIAQGIKADHVVAVTEDCTIETPDENVSTLVTRGVYVFTSFKKARHFTTIVNGTIEEGNIAHMFNRKDETENDY